MLRRATRMLREHARPRRPRLRGAQAGGGAAQDQPARRVAARRARGHAEPAAAAAAAALRDACDGALRSGQDTSGALIDMAL